MEAKPSWSTLETWLRQHRDPVKHRFLLMLDNVEQLAQGYKEREEPSPVQKAQVSPRLYFSLFAALDIGIGCVTQAAACQLLPLY